LSNIFDMNEHEKLETQMILVEDCDFKCFHSQNTIKIIISAILAHMEKLTALYYPTILIPRGSWLNYTLLYWEELASIKPQSWIDQVENKYLDERNVDAIYTGPSANVQERDNWMNTWNHPDQFLTIQECKNLEEAGYLRTIRPEKIMNDTHKLKSFEHELKAFINSRRGLPKCGQNRRVIDETWIQTDKVSHDISRYLILKKLVHKDTYTQDGLNYYLFERETGDIYMSLLARYLADCDSRTTIPFTKFLSSYDVNYKPTDNKQKYVCANILMNLPVPEDTIPLERILEFRRKYRPDFERFRNDIARLEQQVKRMDSDADVIDECENYIRHISIDVEKCKEHLIDERINTISASIRACLSKKELAKGAGSGLTINQIFSWAAGVPVTPMTMAVSSAAGIIENSALRIFDDWVHNKTRESAELREFPFAYLYHADLSRIINANSRRTLRH